MILMPRNMPGFFYAQQSNSSDSQLAYSCNNSGGLVSTVSIIPFFRAKAKTDRACGKTELSSREQHKFTPLEYIGHTQF